MNIDKYKSISATHGIIDVILIKRKDIIYDPRVIMKCRWGCDAAGKIGIRCADQGLSVEDRKNVLFSYDTALLLHGTNSHEMTMACLAVERELFLDGYYLAFSLRACNFCRDCAVKKDRECSNPEKVRPCEGLFGIDVFKTAHNLGLPIDVLQKKDDVQNRYGFVLVQ